eukprot:543211-Prymnesium_polylepis.1
MAEHAGASNPSVTISQLVSACTASAPKRARISSRSASLVFASKCSAVMPASRSAAHSVCECSTLTAKKIAERFPARSLNCATICSVAGSARGASACVE